MSPRATCRAHAATTAAVLPSTEVPADEPSSWKTGWKLVSVKPCALACGRIAVYALAMDPTGADRLLNGPVPSTLKS